MRLSSRHIFLLIGIVSVMISFLFFGRAQKTYSFLLIGGIIIATLSYINILFKDTRRSKIVWSTIIILSACIQQLTEKSLIRQSFKILIEKNRDILNKVNGIFISKPGNILYLKNDVKDSLKLFSQKEVETINDLFKETNIRLITKDSFKVYYETYGMLDVRIGIRFLYFNSQTDFKTGLRTYIGQWDY